MRRVGRTAARMARSISADGTNGIGDGPFHRPVGGGAAALRRTAPHPLIREVEVVEGEQVAGPPVHAGDVVPHRDMEAGADHERPRRSVH